MQFYFFYRVLATNYFKKRSYTFRRLLKDISFVVENRKQIRETMKSRRISYQFEKKIMLAVTAVNGCRYCEWAHTKAALEDGCTEEEINDIMTSDFESCNQEEIIALAFAQHYADTEGNPSRKAIKKLVGYYGKKKATDILLIIKMITIASNIEFKITEQKIIVLNGKDNNQ